MRKASPTKDIPPPLELACLKALWVLGEGSVKTVRERMTEHRDLAYTTVMTVLDRLAKKNVVIRRKVGRSFVYAPLVDRESLRRVAVRDLLDTYFDGEQTNLADWLKVSAPIVEPIEKVPSHPVSSSFDTSLL
jgi:predicted transcriptional regulator